MASPRRPRRPVPTEVLWLLEDLLDALRQPLTMGALVGLTALLLLRLLLAPGA